MNSSVVFLTLFHTQKQALVSSQDVQYADIDHMYKQMDFTIDHDRFPGLNAYFQGLQQKGMKTIIILVKNLILNFSWKEIYIFHESFLNARCEEWEKSWDAFISLNFFAIQFLFVYILV